ncbi:hypothetical protein Ancab_037089 [Ancistrocladus abbreviatus]
MEKKKFSLICIQCVENEAGCCQLEWAGAVQFRCYCYWLSFLVAKLWNTKMAMQLGVLTENKVLILSEIRIQTTLEIISSSEAMQFPKEVLATVLPSPKLSNCSWRLSHSLE